jgi:hypothetical protein
MARAAGVPLLPVTIWGSQRVWTKGRPRNFGRSHTPISIAVGEPLPVPPKVSPDAVTDELRARMTTLLHGLQDTYPDKPADDDDRWWLPARLGGTAPTLEEAALLDAADVEARKAKRAARTGEAPPTADPGGAEASEQAN